MALYSLQRFSHCLDESDRSEAHCHLLRVYSKMTALFDGSNEFLAISCYLRKTRSVWSCGISANERHHLARKPKR